MANKVVTVTINPAIDQTVAVPNFTAGTVNRVQYFQMDAGGKGINVASNLTDYGVPCIVTGFLGNENDEIFIRFFIRKGIEDRFVRIEGQTRTGVKIIDEVGRRTTDINFPGEKPAPADIEHLFSILDELALENECFVLAGSIPAGVPAGIYYDMVKALSGKKVVLDTSGQAFSMALPAGPWLIKPNIDELQELVGSKLETPAAILSAGRELGQRYGITCVVVSMGKEGAIFIESEQAVWAAPPQVEVKEHRGGRRRHGRWNCGRQAGGLPLVDCARLATAFSMSAISHISSGLPSRQEVEQGMEQVTIREISHERS
jgi:1-phosphofructokinase